MAKEPVKIKDITYYYKCIDTEPLQDDLLIIADSESAGMQTEKNIKKNLPGVRNVYIATDNADAGFFSRLFRRGIQTVKKNGNEYYHALAICRFLYTDTLISSYYVKRAGQTVCLDYGKCDDLTDPDQLAKLSVLSIAADCRSIDAMAVNDSAETDKNNVLIMIDDVGYPFYWDDIRNRILTGAFDGKNVYLFVTAGFRRTHLDSLEEIKDKVHLIIKRSGWKINAAYKEEYENYRVLSKSRGDEDIKISDSLTKLFTNEAHRIYGNRKFDLILNFCKSSIYMDTLTLTMAPDELVLFSERSHSRERRVKLQQSILGRENVALEYVYNNRTEVEEYEGVRSSCYSYIPLLGKPSYASLVSGLKDGQDILICSEEANDLPGVRSMNVVEFFPENQYSYLILDNSLDASAWLALIEKIKEQEPKLHIYDFFGIFKDSASLRPWATRKATFNALKSRYVRCCWYEGSSEEIALEAKAAGLPVSGIDDNGRMTDGVDVKSKGNKGNKYEFII